MRWKEPSRTLHWQRLLALLSEVRSMATLTIRQLDERTHARLRVRAAESGRSVEAEVRAILDETVNLPSRNLLLALHEQVGPVDLQFAARDDLPREVAIS